jgi:glutathione S-transferase
MKPVVLYGLARSVYTRIARLALEEKGVAYSLEEVDIFGPDGVPASHRLRHPFGRIPVLKVGEFELYETGAITRFVDEAFSGVRLQPAGAADRARMNQLIGIVDAYAYRPMVWGVFVQCVSVPKEGGQVDAALVDRSLREAETCLLAIQNVVGTGPFLLGAELSLADLHLFPVLRYFALVPEARSLLARYPKLDAWFDGMTRRPSVQRTNSRYDFDE